MRENLAKWEKATSLMAVVPLIDEKYGWLTRDSFDNVFRCDSDLESKRLDVLGGEGQRRRAEPGQTPPSVLIITSTSSGKHMTRLA